MAVVVLAVAVLLLPLLLFSITALTNTCLSIVVGREGRAYSSWVSCHFLTTLCVHAVPVVAAVAAAAAVAVANPVHT